MRSIRLFLVAIALASPAHAVTTELVAQGFSAPLDLVSAHDGGHRLFVAASAGCRAVAMCAPLQRRARR